MKFWGVFSPNVVARQPSAISGLFQRRNRKARSVTRNLAYVFFLPVSQRRRRRRRRVELGARTPSPILQTAFFSGSRLIFFFPYYSVTFLLGKNALNILQIV
jgi:hypothetical protein